MISGVRVFRNPFHLVLVAVYLTALFTSTSHVHHTVASCDDHGVSIQTSACCGDHCHSDSECSLCEFLQTSNSIVLYDDPVFQAQLHSSIVVSHQTIAYQICFGDAPSRAPPVC